MYVTATTMIHVVLAIIQEKVNNPTPDDPFEPEIAAVKHDHLSIFC